MELWKAYPLDKRYHVSNQGRVKSYARKVARILKPIQYGKGKRCQEHSYVVIRKKCHSIGKVVLLTFVGPAPKSKPFALHKDDRASNNCLRNLRWGSYEDNWKDSIRNGKRTASKLTAEVLKKAISLRKKGAPLTSIAKITGVHVSVLSVEMKKRDPSYVRRWCGKRKTEVAG